MSVHHSPAAQKNKEPILTILERYFTKENQIAKVLEISSGGGTHVAHYAKVFPGVTWHPTEYDVNHLGSIRAAVREATGREPGQEGCNVKEPEFLDVSKPVTLYPRGSFDAMLNINLVHISAFRVAEGLFEAAGALLRPGGRLFTYGPYAENGVLTPDSNVSFDASLRRQNPEWGIRDIKELNEEASKNSLCLEASHEMPANNKVLVWKKTS